MIAAALRDKIVATPIVSGRLADYDFGDGILRPCVFMRRAPRDAGGRLLTISQLPSEPVGNRNQHGASFEFDVNIWDDKTKSDAEIRIIAMNLWEALNRGTLTISGWNFRGMTARMPEEIEDGEGFPGYNISISIEATKEIET